jgi:branched-chain amino acid transport system ATP-binding protein
MLTVEENLRLALISQPSPDFKAETEKAYRMFPILGERKRQKARTLSGGELQMLAIARAIMGPTRLLLMDEPSEGLAPVILKQIGKTVHELKVRNITILLAEQNLQFALDVGEYFYIVDNGSIVFSGDKASLLSNEEIQVRYLGVGI